MKKLNEVLTNILSRNIMETAMEHKRLYSAWSSIVEKAFTKNKYIQKNDVYISDTYISKEYKDLINARKAADHSAVKYIKNNTIYIEADHQGWIQILQTRQNILLKIAAEQFPDLGINSIAFVLANAADTSKKAGKLNEQTKIEYQSKEEQRNLAETVKNTELTAQNMENDILSTVKNEQFRDLLRQLEKKIQKS